MSATAAPPDLIPLTAAELARLHKAIDLAQDSGACRYERNGGPCCVVAQDLALMGVPLAVLTELSGTVAQDGLYGAMLRDAGFAAALEPQLQKIHKELQRMWDKHGDDEPRLRQKMHEWLDANTYVILSTPDARALIETPDEKEARLTQLAAEAVRTEFEQWASSFLTNYMMPVDGIDMAEDGIACRLLLSGDLFGTGTGAHVEAFRVRRTDYEDGPDARQVYAGESSTLAASVEAIHRINDGPCDTIEFAGVPYIWCITPYG